MFLGTVLNEVRGRSESIPDKFSSLNQSIIGTMISEMKLRSNLSGTASAFYTEPTEL